VDDLLAKLAKRLQVFDADIISADEIVDWPGRELHELVKAGILILQRHFSSRFSGG